MSKTVIIGASTNPARVAYESAHRLAAHGVPFVPVSIKLGEVAGQQILDLKEKPKIKDVDTITLYLGPKNQEPWLDYIISLKPRRIIFNPGTENPTLIKLANENGIDADIACTLTLLATGQY